MLSLLHPHITVRPPCHDPTLLTLRPDEEEPVSVPATDLEYAKGLTARQNTWIREQQRQQNKEGLNSVGLQEAKASITTTVEELMTSRRLRERRQSAVLKGASSNRKSSDNQPSKTPQKPKATPKTQSRSADRGTHDALEAVPILEPFFMSVSRQGGSHES